MIILLYLDQIRLKFYSFTNPIKIDLLMYVKIDLLISDYYPQGIHDFLKIEHLFQTEKNNLGYNL